MLASFSVIPEVVTSVFLVSLSFYGACLALIFMIFLSTKQAPVVSMSGVNFFSNFFFLNF